MLGIIKVIFATIGIVLLVVDSVADEQTRRRVTDAFGRLKTYFRSLSESKSAMEPVTRTLEQFQEYMRGQLSPPRLAWRFVRFAALLWIFVMWPIVWVFGREWLTVPPEIANTSFLVMVLTYLCTVAALMLRALGKPRGSIFLFFPLYLLLLLTCLWILVGFLDGIALVLGLQTFPILWQVDGFTIPFVIVLGFLATMLSASISLRLLRELVSRPSPSKAVFTGIVGVLIAVCIATAVLWAAGKFHNFMLAQYFGGNGRPFHSFSRDPVLPHSLIKSFSFLGVLVPLIPILASAVVLAARGLSFLAIPLTNLCARIYSSQKGALGTLGGAPLALATYLELIGK